MPERGIERAPFPCVRTHVYGSRPWASTRSIRTVRSARVVLRVHVGLVPRRREVLEALHDRMLGLDDLGELSMPCRELLFATSAMNASEFWNMNDEQWYATSPLPPAT